LSLAVGWAGRWSTGLPSRWRGDKGLPLFAGGMAVEKRRERAANKPD
jgi:hypothetical protein